MPVDPRLSRAMSASKIVILEPATNRQTEASSGAVPVTLSDPVEFIENLLNVFLEGYPRPHQQFEAVRCHLSVQPE